MKVVTFMYIAMVTAVMFAGAQSGNQKPLLQTNTDNVVRDFKSYLEQGTWTPQEAEQRINKATRVQQIVMRNMLQAAMGSEELLKKLQKIQASKTSKKPIVKSIVPQTENSSVAKPKIVG